MDAVVTYVNGLDPLWQQDYERTVGKSILTKRYRDWGTLKYHFRGIAKYMPFIDRIHLVVARESQVPSWVNRETVNVVLHSDIIPAEHLPTFNSTTIEMFLHRIPGLSERFLYFNDDTYTVAPCREEDFYIDGKPATKFAHNFLYFGDFRFVVHHADELARNVLGIPASCRYVRPQHTVSPMLKSESEALFAKAEKEIMESLTPLRSRANYTQYMFLDYLYYQGKAVNRKISNRHFSLAAHSIDSVCDFLRNPSTKMTCINDVQMSAEKFEQSRGKLLAAFEEILPEKSRFEL